MNKQFKKLFLLLLLIATSLYSNGQVNPFKWYGMIANNNMRPVPYCHIQVAASNSYYLFVSDEKGKVNICYPRPDSKDSVTVSCVGYQTKVFPQSKLSNIDTIFLKKEVFAIDEAVVKPPSVKIRKIGNLNNSAYYSSQVMFGAEKGLYIPNEGINGRIVTVRVYIHNHMDKKWNYRPFKINLYQGDTLVGERLIKEDIIASLKPTRENWAEIDIEALNIRFPKEGVYVTIEAFSADYYIENGIISSDRIKYKRYNVMNSFSIGATKKSQKKSGNIKSWDKFNEITGWTPDRNNYFNLIQLEIKTKDDRQHKRKGYNNVYSL